jgi:hypothetical protein
VGYSSYTILIVHYTHRTLNSSYTIFIIYYTHHPLHPSSTIPIIHYTLGAVCFEFARATGLNKPLPKAGLFGKGEAVITFMLTDEQEDMLVFHGGERCSTDEGDENLMPVWTHYVLHSLCTVLTMHCTHYALYSLGGVSLLEYMTVAGYGGR